MVDRIEAKITQITEYILTAEPFSVANAGGQISMLEIGAMLDALVTAYDFFVDYPIYDEDEQ